MFVEIYVFDKGVNRFEDLIVWKKAQSLTVAVYHCFAETNEYFLKDQICRASLSISNNIAEGFSRNSNKDFARFLSIAMGSCNEVKSMLYLSSKLDFIKKEKAELLIESSTEIYKMLSVLLKHLKSNQDKR